MSIQSVLADAGVSIIVTASSFKNSDRIFNNYIRQKIKNKELVIVVNSELESFEQWVSASKNYPMVRVYEQFPDTTAGECLNYGIEQSIYEYIAIFHEYHYYDCGYISNSIKKMCIKPAMLVGKKSYYTADENLVKQSLVSAGFENLYTDYVILPTFMFKSELIKIIRFIDSNTQLDSAFCGELRKRCLKIYSSDKEDYLYCSLNIL